jgi:hypothetical protein
MVDAHLDGCPSCRDEVELASRARSALASLPELSVPPNTVRPGLQRAGSRRVPSRFRGAVPWAAGFAAAASIAGIVSLAVLAGGGGGGHGLQEAVGVSPEGGAAASETAVQVQRSSVDYNTDKIRALASSLADRYAERTASAETLTGPGSGTVTGGGGGGTGGGTGGADTSGPVPAPTTNKLIPASGDQFSAAIVPNPEGCIRQGAEARLPKHAEPVKIIAARFQGVPAYIGAFLQDGAAPERLVVWVVNRRDCSIMTYLAQPLS